MAKLSIPTKTDGVSELNASEVNKIVSAINETVDEVTELQKNESIIDGGEA